jgi:ribose-phosphate pyrophosphokinase
MSPLAIHAFEPDQPPAARLARALGASLHRVSRRHFPDGESLVRVTPGDTARAVLFVSLDHPDGKLFDMQLAADALSAHSAGRPILVAPYLPYMRQDVEFHAGEAVSQRVFGHLLATSFSAVVTVTPHLHRTASLDEILPGCRAVGLSAAPALAEMLAAEGGAPPLLVGPDCESERLVAAVAQRLTWPWMALRKERQGDLQVTVAADSAEMAAGARVVLIDDVCSSGATFAAAADALLAAGATSVEAAVVHALFNHEAAARMSQSGIGRIVSLDSILHPSNAASLTPLLAAGLRELLS